MKDKYKKYIDYIAKDIQVPYLKSLEPYGLKQDEIVLVFSKVFNEAVCIGGNNVYNINGKEIYWEDSNGYWEKREYDNNGNIIYGENSDADWIKREYDNNGNVIYYENSNGEIVDRR